MGFGSGGGSSAIAGASDVTFNNPLNLDVLTYDSTTAKWKNAAAVAAGVSSVAGKTGAVTLAKADVGLENVNNTSDATKPISIAAQTALDAKAATTDVRFTDTRIPTDASVSTDKIIDNAVTTAKLSTAIQSTLAKAESALQTAPVTSVASKTGTVTLVKGDVGLANVDNTADSAKPISTATQTALDAKIASNDSRLTDTRVPTDASVTTAKVADNAITSVKLATAVQTSLSKADSALQTAPVTSVASRTGAITLTKTDVGLANVDNTADSAKPVSTAAQTALNAKANTTHIHSGADITSGTIDAARLPIATDTVSGIVELATSAEVATGTDTIRAATPAGVKSLVTSAITAAIPTVVFVNTLADIPVGTPVDTLVVVRAA